jgi:hypothetical protein
MSLQYISHVPRLLPYPGFTEASALIFLFNFYSNSHVAGQLANNPLGLTWEGAGKCIC